MSIEYPTVALSAGHSPQSRGATNNWIAQSEHELCTQICWYATGELGYLDTAPNVIAMHTGPLWSKIDTVNQLSDNLPGLFAVEVHLNSGPMDIRGFEAFVYPTNAKTRAMAKEIEKAFKRPSWPSRGVKSDTQSQHTNGLGWIRRTTCPAILLELGFMSNEQDRKLMTTLQGLHTLGVRLANGIADAASHMYAFDSKKTRKEVYS